MTTILEAINRAAAQAIDLGGRPTVFTAGPRLTAILARARAMRALGLPHPWAPGTYPGLASARYMEAVTRLQDEAPEARRAVEWWERTHGR